MSVRHYLEGCEPGFYAVPIPGNRLKVYAPDGTQIGESSNRADAAARADRHFRAQRIKVRPCLCCGSDFKSEGAHNRMCKTCRETSEGMI